MPQVVKQSQSELEQTAVTAITPMEHAHPAVLLTERTQIDAPDVGATGGQPHTRETCGVCQRRCRSMEAATFLVRAKSGTPQPLRLQATCLGCRRQIREHIQRSLLPCGPATAEPARPRSLFRPVSLLPRDAGAWLATGGHRRAPAGGPSPHHAAVAPCADHVGPVLCVYRLLATGPITLALAQQDHCPLRGEQVVHVCDQGDGQVFGKVPLLALANLLRQRPRTPFTDHVEHAGHPAASHDTTIQHQAQGLQGSMGQQKCSLRHKIHRLGALRVPDPSGKAFATACRRGAVGHMAGALGQLGTLARHQATAQRRQGGHVPRDCASGLARILLS